MSDRRPGRHGTPPMWLLPYLTEAHVAVYKLSSGRLGATLMGHPMLLLRTIGRRSGKVHTVALNFLTDGESMIVLASSAGAAKHPAWYHNMNAASEVIVRNRDQVFWARHEPVEGAARTELWEKLVAAEPAYAEYAAKTDRVIPVVRLTYSRPYTG
jgi:deazaflavin-dependent oxidoreductase (nitroreductase family)